MSRQRILCSSDQAQDANLQEFRRKSFDLELEDNLDPKGADYWGYADAPLRDPRP